MFSDSIFLTQADDLLDRGFASDVPDVVRAGARLLRSLSARRAGLRGPALRGRPLGGRDRSGQRGVPICEV